MSTHSHTVSRARMRARASTRVLVHAHDLERHARMPATRAYITRARTRARMRLRESTRVLVHARAQED